METAYSSAMLTGFAKTLTTIWLLLVVIIPGLAMAQTTTIALSADTEGRTRHVQQCCGDPGSGGLERRATLVKQLRAQDGNLLLVDAGNSFFGGDSLSSRGEVIAAAYELLGYDAINVSWRDFRLGKDATVRLIACRKFAAVSASLIDETSGELLFQPFLVKQVAGERVAILGVTQSPAGLDVLPHLKDELKGIRILPLDEALAKWLPTARAEADSVLLLYYGSAAGLHPLAAKFGSQLDAILVGGARPMELPQDANPPQLATEEYGRELGVIYLPAKVDTGRATTEHLLIEATLTPDPDMVERLKKFK